MKNWFELKYSLRVLRKTPGHTSMCVAIVALSLCVGMIALTLVYNLMYKPLNFKDADRWVHLTRITNPGGVSEGGDSINSYHYQYLKDNSSIFENLGALRAFSQSRMRAGETATQVSSAEITPHIFEASGLPTYLGRSLTASDGESNNQVAVISYALWQNYFSSDPSIIGETVSIDETPLTIVGVMARDTAFGMKHDIWIANQAWLAAAPDDNNIRPITPVGILKTGVSLNAAQAELSKLTQQLIALYPDYFGEDVDILVSPFKQFLMEESTPIFLSVAAFSCIIVLLGAINIANLLISRTIERRQEFAIRNCVGSSPLDALRQSLSESFLICFAAALIALPVTFLGMKGTNYYLDNVGGAQGWAVPTDWYLQFDGAALTVAMSVLILIWLISGLSPLLKLRQVKVGELLSGSKGTSDQNSFRATKILVGTQIVAAFFLLIVSGSLLVSILRIVNTDYGIEVENRYVVDLEFPGEYFFSPPRRATAIKDIEHRLSLNNGIKAASTVSGLPHTTWGSPFTIGDRDLSNNGIYPNLKVSSYSPEAFDLLGIEIISGRNFDSTDLENAEIVTIIDKNLAESMWSDESPLNKKIRVQFPAKPDTWLTVIGVSEPVIPGMRFASFNRENSVYVPIGRHFHNFVQIVIHTRSKSSLAEVFSWVRDAVADTDANVAVYNPRTISEHLLGPTYGLQMIANIFIGFGIVAVVLAIVGVFAVISRSVLQQTRSIGIRRAIGSSNRKVLIMYFKQGCVYLLTGLVIGGGAALSVNNLLSSLFSDLPQATPLVVLAVIIGLGGMVTLASLAPTQRALKFEPGDALHRN
jgi:predicted permease